MTRVHGTVLVKAGENPVTVDFLESVRGHRMVFAVPPEFTLDEWRGGSDGAAVSSWGHEMRLWDVVVTFDGHIPTPTDLCHDRVTIGIYDYDTGQHASADVTVKQAYHRMHRQVVLEGLVAQVTV